MAVLPDGIGQQRHESDDGATGEVEQDLRGNDAHPALLMVTYPPPNVPPQTKGLMIPRLIV